MEEQEEEAKWSRMMQEQDRELEYKCMQRKDFHSMAF